MKKFAVVLALALVSVACKCEECGKKMAVKDASAPEVTAPAACTKECSGDMKECAGKSCADKKECSGEAKVCPVSGKPIQ